MQVQHENISRLNQKIRHLYPAHTNKERIAVNYTVPRCIQLAAINCDNSGVFMISSSGENLFETDWPFSSNTIKPFLVVDLIFVVPCIMLNSEIIPTRCNNCVYSSQWLYSTCFG